MPAPAPTTEPAPAAAAPAPAPAPAAEPAPEPVAAAPVDIERMRQSWPAILDRIQQLKMSSWTVVYTALPVALDDDVLTLVFTNESDAAAFKQRGNPAEMVSEHVRQAILAELGLRVKFLVRVDSARAPRPEAAAPAEQPTDPEPSPAPQSITEWAVAAIPGAPAPSSVDAPPVDDEPPPVDDEPEPEPEPPAPVHLTEIAGRQRYGEAVVREVLGARFIAEEPIAPTVVPQEAPPEPEGF